MLEMEQVLDELYEKGKRLFFIDEVTLIEDLQVYGNVFSDYYRTMGAKIVIAGTDSFGIYMAKTDILYDRTILIHTSQIPYAEFKRICKKIWILTLSMVEHLLIPLIKITKMQMSILIQLS